MAVTLGIVGLSQAGQVDGPAEVSFNDQIRPIFNKHCAACHGGVKQASDISFAYRDQVLPPNGWIVEPGEPEASILIERVTSDDPEERMPPAEHGPPLSKQEIELLTQWIERCQLGRSLGLRSTDPARHSQRGPTRLVSSTDR